MKKNVFIAQGQKRIETVYISFLFLFATMALAGCSFTSGSSPLAPRPPQMDLSSLPREPITMVQLDSAAHNKALAGPEEAAKIEKIALGYTPSAKGCSVKSRFDREALMAYEWGDGGRQRLALDVDGIGFDQFDLEQVRLEYKIRLSAEPTKKQRCRYASSWQGMLGSGYNEMFVREGGDTIWNELGDLEEDIDENLGDLF
jgi:hypothetical protein